MNSPDQYARDSVESQSEIATPSYLLFTQQEIAEAHQNIIDILNQRPIEFDLGNGQTVIYL